MARGVLFQILPRYSIPELCPATALEAYQEAFQYEPDSILFRSLRTGKPMIMHSINWINKQSFVEEYSSHSLRASFITWATQNGATPNQIMEQSKHKSLNGLMAYFQRQSIHKNPALNGLFGNL